MSAAVKKYQKYLNSLGYKLAEDGIWENEPRQLMKMPQIGGQYQLREVHLNSLLVNLSQYQSSSAIMS